VTVVENINDNIIDIDFMHANRMNYDTALKQITFAHMFTNALYLLKETTIPALSTMIIQAKFKGNVCNTASPVATIHAPTNPAISGMPALVTLDKYRNCKLVINNCAPYEVTLARNEVLGVLEFEPDKCILLNEKTISALISDIADQLPKESLPVKKLNKKLTSKCPNNLRTNIWTFFLNNRPQLASISSIWVEKKILPTKSTSKTIIRCTENNLKFWRLTKLSLRQHLTNG